MYLRATTRGDVTQPDPLYNSSPFIHTIVQATTLLGRMVFANLCETATTGDMVCGVNPQQFPLQREWDQPTSPASLEDVKNLVSQVLPVIRSFSSGD